MTHDKQTPPGTPWYSTGRGRPPSPLAAGESEDDFRSRLAATDRNAKRWRSEAFRAEREAFYRFRDWLAARAGRTFVVAAAIPQDAVFGPHPVGTEAVLEAVHRANVVVRVAGRRRVTSVRMMRLRLDAGELGFRPD